MQPDDNPYLPPMQQTDQPNKRAASSSPRGSYKFRPRDAFTCLTVGFWLAIILIPLGLWAVGELVWLLSR